MAQIPNLQSTNTLGENDQAILRQGTIDKRIGLNLAGILSWARRNGYNHLGEHTTGIQFPDTASFTTFQGKAYFVNEGVTLPYSATSNDPSTDTNLYSKGEDSLKDEIYSTVSNPNQLSNHNFLVPSSLVVNATPQDVSSGVEIFSGVFAGSSGIQGLTYIDGRVSFSGGDFYMPVANTGGIERVTEFSASVADFDGKPRTRGVSFALVGNEYRVTVDVDALEDTGGNPTPLGSVKFEQGGVATGHDTESLSARNLGDYTAIVYKASGSNSAVDNMLSEIPVVARVGDICSTGSTLWEKISDSNGDISDFKALNAVCSTDYGAKGSNTRSQNSAALNAMSADGHELMCVNQFIEIDDTWLLHKDCEILGIGKYINAIAFYGGDVPIIAPVDYTDGAAAGVSNTTIRDMKIADRCTTTRSTYYSIDLTNGNSNQVKDFWLNGVEGTLPNENYGVNLGRRTLAYSGNTFVCAVRSSRIEKAKVRMNTTDWYISDSELWGNDRDYAILLSGGGSIENGNQIIPGEVGGIGLFNESGFDIDTLKVIGNYFDGSFTSVFTGDGIVNLPSYNGGLVSPVITNNNFWRINEKGINLLSVKSGLIKNNSFRDCDSDDTGDNDIVIGSMYGTEIYNSHFRDANAPKTGNPRVNLGKPYEVTADAGFPLNSCGGVVSFDSTYTDASITNVSSVRDLGGSNLCIPDRANLPSAQLFNGETVRFNGESWRSNGTNWAQDTSNLILDNSITDFNNVDTTSKRYIGSVNSIANRPSGATGSATLETMRLNNDYVMQVLTLWSQNIVSRRLLDNGVWGSWF